MSVITSCIVFKKNAYLQFYAYFCVQNISKIPILAAVTYYYPLKWQVANLEEPRIVSYFCVLLQVFINASVTHAIVGWSELQQSYYIRRDHSAVLCDTDIVMKVLLSWRVWDSAVDSVWLLALDALRSLVTDDHVYQLYNVSQLYDAGIIAKMLDIWKVSRVYCVLYCKQSTSL